jgi:hypothetical protein
MTFLPSIFKRVDDFCKIAEFYDLISRAAPDDSALYAELVSAAQQVVNPEVSYTLQILADMYRKALDINGGFNVLYKTVEGIVQDLDPEEEESEQVEDLLNKIGASIRLRGRQADSPQAMRELQMAASEAKRRLAEQAPDVPEEEDHEDQTSAYEAALMGDYETPEKMFEEEGGVAKFDPTAGMKPEDAAQGKGRGYSVGKKYTYKDWADVYTREKEKYNQDLNGSDSTVTRAVRTARTNEQVRSNLESLITVLDKLEKLTKEALGIEHKLLLETEIAHPQEEKKLAEISRQLREAEHQRVLLKRRLSNYYKEAELVNLRKQEAATTDLRQKRILQQKVALQELRLSGSKGYGNESKERQKLIDSLTADPNLSDEEVKKQLLGIQQASEFTNRITKAMYDRTRTEQQGREQGRGYVPKAEPMRGGGRYKKQVDFDTATYPTMLKRFRELNNTIVSDAKKYVARTGKEKGDEKMAPFVEAISSAIKRKDNAAKFTAINALKMAIKQTLVSDASLRGYLWAIRLAPHFKSIEEFLYNIKGRQDAAGAWNLGEAERATLRTAAQQLQRMQDIYTQYFPRAGGRYGRSHYMTSVDFYPKLIGYIYSNILQEDPPSLESTAQDKRKRNDPPRTPEQKERKKFVDRIRTIEKSKEQGKNIMIGRETDQRGGHSELEKLRNFNPSDATFGGLVHLFQEKINSSMNTIKQHLYLPKTGGDPALRPYISNLSDAVAKGDDTAKYEAIKLLREAIASQIGKDGGFQRLVKLARLIPHFRQLRDQLKLVSKWENPNTGRWDLTEDRKNYLVILVTQAARLEQIYSNYYSGSDQLDLGLKAPIEMLSRITERLTQAIAQGETHAQ